MKFINIKTSWETNLHMETTLLSIEKWIEVWIDYKIKESIRY
jgi:hypothetical protein